MIFVFVASLAAFVCTVTVVVQAAWHCVIVAPHEQGFLKMNPARLQLGLLFDGKKKLPLCELQAHSCAEILGVQGLLFFSSAYAH